MPTFTEALHVWEAAKSQLDECRVAYLRARNFGNSISQFKTAFMLAEAFCQTEEKRLTYEGVCNEELRVSLLETMIGERAVS